MGFVYRPAWLDGFDISVDWLSVNLKGSIEQFLAQDIVNACYIQNNPDQCRNITFDPNGEFTLVNQTYQNVSKAKISGIDFELGYSTPFELLGGGGRLSARLFASYLDENSTTNSSEDQDRSRRSGGGTLLAAREKATANLSYSNGPFIRFLQLRYIGPGIYDTQNGIGTNNWVVADNYGWDRLPTSIRGCRGTSRSATVRSSCMRAGPICSIGIRRFCRCSARRWRRRRQFNAGLYDVLGGGCSWGRLRFWTEALNRPGGQGAPCALQPPGDWRSEPPGD